MNSKSFLLDVGLPALVMVATGLATYMLTGGPEEFPEPEPPQTGCEEDSSDGSENEGIEDRHRVVADNIVPQWASELSAQTKSLSEELRLLKEATQASMQLQQEQTRAIMMQRSLCGQCRGPLDGPESNQPGTGSAKIETPEQPKPWTLEDWQTQLRCRMWRLAHPTAIVTENTSLMAQLSNEGATHTDATDAEAVDPVLTSACELLLMYLTNLAKNPGVPRYRRISTVNATYAKSLSNVVGHEDVLYALGFARKPDSTVFEYDWHSLPADAAAQENNSVTGSRVANSAQRPATAAEAKALLDEAVDLLIALKSGRKALRTKLMALLTTTENAKVAGTTKGGGPVPMSMPPASGEKATNGASGSNRTSTGANSSVVHPNPTPVLRAVDAALLPTAPPSAAEEGALITVVDLPDEEPLHGAGNSAADSLDFMQILQKAQEAGK